MARRLTLEGATVVVLEKALDVLDGASKGNSAILHTGFDAPPGSLEHACLVQGYKEYLEVSKELGLPIVKCGALVLAWDKEQWQKLPGLIEKSKKNGVRDVKMLTQPEIQQREHRVSDQVVGGFEVPGEYLIDPWTSAHVYLLQAMEHGARLARRTEILGGEFDGHAWTLNSNQGDFRAAHVINCTGLFGDIVDTRLLGQKAFTITPRKGQFIIFDKSAAALVNSILLPVPTQKTKGVVVCRTIFGNLLVGPTAEDQKSRDDASTDPENIERLRARGVKMLPGLRHHEITAVYAGLRPATEFSDYQIQEHGDRNYVSVGGIRSTGLSAALGIARYVGGLIGINDFSGPAIDQPSIPPSDRLSNYHQRDWEKPGNGGIVCHCELVTRREIERVMSSALPPATLQGLKRRTRVGMGRCQGIYCTGELAKITGGHFTAPIGSKNGKT
jgi:glycerol-3-phosphate dehydrogenase